MQECTANTQHIARQVHMIHPPCLETGAALLQYFATNVRQYMCMLVKSSNVDDKICAWIAGDHQRADTYVPASMPSPPMYDATYRAPVDPLTPMYTVGHDSSSSPSSSSTCQPSPPARPLLPFERPPPYAPPAAALGAAPPNMGFLLGAHRISPEVPYYEQQATAELRQLLNINNSNAAVHTDRGSSLSSHAWQVHKEPAAFTNQLGHERATALPDRLAAVSENQDQRHRGPAQPSSAADSSSQTRQQSRKNDQVPNQGGVVSGNGPGSRPSARPSTAAADRALPRTSKGRPQKGSGVARALPNDLDLSRLSLNERRDAGAAEGVTLSESGQRPGGGPAEGTRRMAVPMQASPAGEHSASPTV